MKEKLLNLWKKLKNKPAFWITVAVVFGVLVYFPFLSHQMSSSVLFSDRDRSTSYDYGPTETGSTQSGQGYVYEATEDNYIDETDEDYEEKDTPTEKPEKKTEIKNETSSDDFYAYGDGDYVATGLNVTGYAVLHIDYTGAGNFSVVSYEGDKYDNLLVNAIGNYSGDVLVDHSGSFSLEIKADDGNWNITSSGLEIDDTTSFSGCGDAVTGITSSSGGIWEITHDGTSNFSVVEYGVDLGYMDLLVNEIGSYSGTVKAESGDNIFFKVNADGNWTIKQT